MNQFNEGDAEQPNATQGLDAPDQEQPQPLATTSQSRGAEAVERVLRRATALDRAGSSYQAANDGDQLDLEERQALRRVAGLSTELQDISEVEYRQLRLEKVILIGLWGQASLLEAENSLRELAALAETAGAQVLDGLLQRRPQPDGCRAREAPLGRPYSRALGRKLTRGRDQPGGRRGHGGARRPRCRRRAARRAPAAA